jgi:small-conductance mechanosensitive channel
MERISNWNLFSRFTTAQFPHHWRRARGTFPRQGANQRGGSAPSQCQTGILRKGISGLLLVLAVGLLVGLTADVSDAAKAAGTPAKTVVLPEPLTHEAIRELVARLTDDEVRQLLLAQLDKAAAPAPPKADEGLSAASLEQEADLIRSRLGSVLRAAPTVPGELMAAVRRFSEGGRYGHLQLPVGCVFFALMLVGGGLVETVLGRLLATVRGGLEDGEVKTFGAQVGRVLLRLTLDLLLLLVFVATVVGVFLIIYQGHGPSRELFLALLVAAVQVRLVIILARLLLAPRAPAQRLLPFNDEAARGLYRGMVGLAGLYGVAVVLREFMSQWGVSHEAWLLVMTGMNILFVAVLLHTVWGQRTPIAGLIRGANPGPLRRVLADLWPVLMTAYVLTTLIAVTVERLTNQTFKSNAGILMILVIIVLPLLDMLLCRLLVERSAGREVVASYVPVLREGVHIAVTIGGLLLIAGLWDIDLFALAARGVGERVTGALINVGAALLLAYLVWQLAKTAIDRRLAREAGPQAVSERGEAGGTGASRLATLLPLARVFIFVTICVMATMTVLAELGVNIGPLLAGAGVVGLAVGFGSQALVRDIMSGAFYLIDDAFRLGEYIDVGDAMGTVEKIGIRSMQLRHHRGPINIVPYGGIRRLNNQSRDWVIDKLTFRLTYDTDIMKVKKILKRIGQELMEHPDIGPQLLEPLKSQGVMAMEDSAMVVRAKFMAKPGNEFLIRREAYQRIKQAFDEAGIKFAHRQVTVFVPPTAAGVAEAAGAAALAAEEEKGRGKSS